MPEARTLKDLARDALIQAVGGADRRARRAPRVARPDCGRARGTAPQRSGLRPEATWDEELAEVPGSSPGWPVSVPPIGAAADPLLAGSRSCTRSRPADPWSARITTSGPPRSCCTTGGSASSTSTAPAGPSPPWTSGGSARSSATSGSARSRRRRPTGRGRLAPPYRHCWTNSATTSWRPIARAPVTADRVVLWETTDLLTALLHAWTKVRTARVRPRLALLRHAVGTSLGVTSTAAG